jgi:hypothetical protein
LPDIVKVRVRVRNMSEACQHGNTCDSHATDGPSSESDLGKDATVPTIPKIGL